MDITKVVYRGRWIVERSEGVYFFSLSATYCQQASYKDELPPSRVSTLRDRTLERQLYRAMSTCERLYQPWSTPVLLPEDLLYPARSRSNFITVLRTFHHPLSSHLGSACCHRTRETVTYSTGDYTGAANASRCGGIGSGYSGDLVAEL